MNTDTTTRTLWFLLVGDPGVGKTSFFNALKGKTVEDEVYRYSYNRKIKRYYVERGGVMTRVHIYDVAQGRPDINIHYSGVDGVLFLYDITKKETFTNLTMAWMRDCQKHAPPGTNKVIVGNKIDQKVHKTVGKLTVAKLATPLNIPFLESSAVTKINVEEAVLALVKSALDRFFPESPRTGSVTMSIDKPNISSPPSSLIPPPPLAPPLAAEVKPQSKPDVSMQSDGESRGLDQSRLGGDDSIPSDSGYGPRHTGVLSPSSPSSGDYEPSLEASVKSLSVSLSEHVPEATSDEPSRILTHTGFDLDGGSPNVDVETIIKELELIFGDKDKHESFRGVRGEVQILMDTLQKLLDCQGISEEFQRLIFIVMLDLTSTGSYPHLMTLRGVRYEGVNGPDKFRKGYYGIYQLCIRVIHESTTIPTDDPQSISKYNIKEALTLSKLNHLNILPFYGIFHLDNPNGRLCIVTPLMQRLDEYLASRNPEASRLAIIFDVLSGLKYLHDNSVIHGDLRAKSVFVNATGTACLGSFGLRNLGMADISQFDEGLRWQAPELMDELRDGDLSCPTKASDVYSAASVMYEILTDQIPFHEVKRDITVVFRASRGIRPTKPASAALPLLELNDGIWQIMQQCWVDDPDKRLTIHQVLERLREVWNLNLTNMRLWKTMVKEKEVCTMPPSAQSFRNAMRGWELVFSKNELDTLKKYSR